MLHSRQSQFQSFPGAYMRDSGLEDWVGDQGGLSAIPEPVRGSVWERERERERMTTYV